MPLSVKSRNCGQNPRDDPLTSHARAACPDKAPGLQDELARFRRILDVLREPKPQHLFVGTVGMPAALPDAVPYLRGSVYIGPIGAGIANWAFPISLRVACRGMSETRN